eukprot:SAG22_NODE_2582_length_2417_cov_2.970233_4_plen_115_part_00
MQNTSSWYNPITNQAGCRVCRHVEWSNPGSYGGRTYKYLATVANLLFILLFRRIYDMVAKQLNKLENHMYPIDAKVRTKALSFCCAFTVFLSKTVPFPCGLLRLERTRSTGRTR